MDNRLYDFSPIVDRPPIQWPGGKRVAFYVGVALEHYLLDKPSTSIFGGTALLKPDPLNFGWRDYGMRVGIWRMIEALDRHGMRGTALLNSDVCALYPEVIEAGRKRDWAWVAHGRDNSTFQAFPDRDEEFRYLREVVSVIAKATRSNPKGWIGPALTETFETPSILAELGLGYVLDWCADDQPFRHKYLDQALEYIATRRDVWLTTTDDIARHFNASILPKPRQ